MKKIILIIFILFLSSSIIYGQITTEEEPISFGRSIPALTINETTQKNLPPLEMNVIEQEDKEDEANGIPPRFGFPHEVNYNLNNSGEWVVLSNGDKIWRLSISCPGALSINLLYDQFWLPDGAKFFIYTPDCNFSIGAMTSENNNGEKNNIQGFATEIMYGDQIILEYYLPEEVREMGIISIAYIVHGYRYIVPCIEGGFECSKPCHNNINCPQAAGWDLEKNAIALIVSSGHRICTGALINTTANDYRPYLLTANHCLANVSPQAYHNISWWTFYWHYESPGCIATTDPGLKKRYATSGGEVLAYNSVSDFALIKLNEDPRNKNNVTPFYLGWDRSENHGTGGVGIHHPKGDIKKISFANQIQNHQNSIHWEGGAISLPNTHWKVNFIDGTTEGGSSGSPFINNERKVIGQLHGGDTTCAPVTKYYGKLSVSWDYNDSIQRQLKHWLDPNQTGAITLNGTFECDGNVTINNKTYNSNLGTTIGCVITITNTTFNNGATGKYYAQNKIVINPGTIVNAGANILFAARGNGGGRGDEEFSFSYPETDEEFYDNEEILASLNLAIESQKITDIDFNVYPNPNDGNFTIKIEGKAESYTVEIFNSMGILIGRVDCDEEVVHVNRADLPSGLYFVKISTEAGIVVKKVVKQ